MHGGRCAHDFKRTALIAGISAMRSGQRAHNLNRAALRLRISAMRSGLRAHGFVRTHCCVRRYQILARGVGCA